MALHSTRRGVQEYFIREVGDRFADVPTNHGERLSANSANRAKRLGPGAWILKGPSAVHPATVTVTAKRLRPPAHRFRRRRIRWVRTQNGTNPVRVVWAIAGRESRRP